MRISKMNRRQRKKHKVGEFQDLFFDFEAVTNDTVFNEQNLDDFMAFLEDNGLGTFCFWEKNKFHGAVGGRTSLRPTMADRTLVGDYLRAMPGVVSLVVGTINDAWRPDVIVAA